MPSCRGSWTYITQASILIRIHTPTDTPDEVGFRLSEGVHVAIEEGHEPRVRSRKVLSQRHRPIAAVRLDLLKGMAGRESRTRLIGVNEARQLVYRGQPPAFPPAGRE